MIERNIEVITEEYLNAVQDLRSCFAITFFCVCIKAINNSDNNK